MNRHLNPNKSFLCWRRCFFTQPTPPIKRTSDFNQSAVSLNEPMQMAASAISPVPDYGHSKGQAELQRSLILLPAPANPAKLAAKYHQCRRSIAAIFSDRRSIAVSWRR